MKCYVYVLRSLRNKKRYTGSTRLTPEERLKQHNNGLNSWSRQNRPFELIYSEEFTDYRNARKREIFLKSGARRKFLDNILKQSSGA